MRLHALAACLLFAAAPASAHDMASVEFATQTIAPGLAVLSGAGGNVAVSWGPDGTLLVDDEWAALTPKLVAAVAALGAQPVRYVVNTHWHVDHAGGNESLGKAGATILAHENVRVRLASGGKVLGNEVPTTAREGLPLVTFDRGLRLHVNGDTLDVIFTGGGHTDGDSVVYWRKANVLHTGDLMMKGKGFPFIDTDSGGSAERLLASLDQLIAITDAATVIVPGHGPLATRDDLLQWRTRIAEAVATVRDMLAAGKPVEAIRAAPAVRALEAPGGFFSADMFIANVGKAPAHSHDH